MNAHALDTVISSLRPTSTHRDVEHELLQAGWVPCGTGDWAFALAAPDGDIVARISPFDPVGPYTARLYSQAAATHRVPRLFVHRRLDGGGDLQVMERLTPVENADASAFLARLAAGEPELEALADTVVGVHRDAQSDLPWCGPLDDNPSNVMRTSDGRLVLTDPYYADGPDLYATAENEPDLLVTRIPEDQRRFITEIPLAGSGPWSREERDTLREKLHEADERRAQHTV